jgi:transposase-like protein
MSKKTPVPNRQYTREFKEEAVRQATTGERPVNSVARELGLRPTVLRDWMRVLILPA